MPFKHINFSNEIDETFVFNIIIIFLCYLWNTRNQTSSIIAATMTGTIKLFDTLQQFYIDIGLHSSPRQSYREKYLTLAKRILFSFFVAQMGISSMAFFFTQAKPYTTEVGISFQVSLTTTSVVICTLNVAWNMDKISMLIGKYEKFIEKRRFNKMSIANEQLKDIFTCLVYYSE